MKYGKIIKKIGIIGAILVFLGCNLCTRKVFASSVPAGNQARLRLGYYWGNVPRNVFFRCDFPANEREAVRAAMQQWNGVRATDGSSLVSVYLTTGDASNYIIKTNSIGNKVGYMDPFTVPGGSELDYVYIMLNSTLSYSVGASAGCYDIQSIILHEMGHALGVAHCHEIGSSGCFSTTCSSNVMQPTLGTNQRRTTFQAYDTASYIMIYQ